jgi:hypothetical protein
VGDIQISRERTDLVSLEVKAAVFVDALPSMGRWVAGEEKEG